MKMRRILRCECGEVLCDRKVARSKVDKRRMTFASAFDAATVPCPGGCKRPTTDKVSFRWSLEWVSLELELDLGEPTTADNLEPQYPSAGDSEAAMRGS